MLAGPVLGVLRRPRTLALLSLAAIAELGLMATPPGAVGLPDGRVYEMVSPPVKNGAAAGAETFGSASYAFASPGLAGEAQGVLFSTSGPMGQEPTPPTTGVSALAIATRSSGGWHTRDAVPRGQGMLDPSDGAIFAAPSDDLSSLVFISTRSFAPGNPEGEYIGSSTSIYRAAADGAITWIGRPKEDFTPDPALGQVQDAERIAGVSADARTVYFTFYGTLLPIDASREAVLASHGGANGTFRGDWGFYEWQAERSSGPEPEPLVSAGVLPDGTISPYGAVPAATTDGEREPQNFDNQVSQDGTRAFFLSPAPAPENPQLLASCLGAGAVPGGCVPELYVRVPAAGGGKRSVLVSRSLLAPPVGGLPAPAPTGPIAVPALNRETTAERYVFASADGERAFFESRDRLTGEAPSPNDSSAAKTYMFDVGTETLSYVPGITGPVVGASPDGRVVVFETSASPRQLDVWSEGLVHALATLPTPSVSPTNFGGTLYVGPVRVTSNGAVVVFESDAPVAGFNDGEGYDQVFRARTGFSCGGCPPQFSCVSCPPNDASPSGDVHLSGDDSERSVASGWPRDSRGISEDGSRVFFDSPDPLVAADVSGFRNVYEWENGRVYLLSSGASNSNSLFLDNSASGNDVFFATTDPLSTVDTDGGYDVYDARVGGGFATAPAPVPCSGDECQGPASAPPVFATPASVSFAGPGNPTVVSGAAAAKVVKKPAVKKKKRRSRSSHVRGRWSRAAGGSGRVRTIGRTR